MNSNILVVRYVKIFVLLVGTYTSVITLILFEKDLTFFVRIPVLMVGAISGFLLLRDLITIGWEGGALSDRERFFVRVCLSSFTGASVIALILYLLSNNAIDWVMDIWRYLL